MTFSKFEELFKSKYPAGKVVAHGKFAGTQRNGKTTLIFSDGGLAYQYYGSYEEILNRVGVKVISASHLRSLEVALDNYRKWHGMPKFMGTGFEDHSFDIQRLDAEIEEIKNNYLVV